MRIQSVGGFGLRRATTWEFTAVLRVLPWRLGLPDLITTDQSSPFRTASYVPVQRVTTQASGPHTVPIPFRFLCTRVVLSRSWH
ncbi:hypothetical protein MPTK1_6g13610 [Marchantia polymorpha subsp. ruderalis]|uniref:Uncharacterized protein n=2 Tax=Marchantia polymorpha TaxID=3197 RepID=A0AAF6BRP8_MARPO|nr:hypothetical protein MARPO_0047s0012 [Marchantia polymorpha]BBN14682.1 hypothetical protein Mp_6g13610 [Marchantia polymorpha subsp. ruderalis]|eukprot:PTQ39020.1 hypothetical protein MARPO_0047s0012 [Marchantia polymorpha]